MDFYSDDGDELDDFELVIDPAHQSPNPRQQRFLPLIRFLSKVTLTTASVITSSVNATATATYPLYSCTPSGLASTSACTSSIAVLQLAREFGCFVT